MSQQTCPKPPAQNADENDLIPSPPDGWSNTWSSSACPAEFIPIQGYESPVYRKSADEPYGFEVTHWPSETAADAVMTLYDEVAKTDLALVDSKVKTGQAGPQSSVFNLQVWLKLGQYIFAAYGKETTPAKTLLVASPALNEECLETASFRREK
jgi:hypothetical protein